MKDFITNLTKKIFTVFLAMCCAFLWSSCSLAASPNNTIVIPTPEDLRTDPLQQLNRMNDLIHKRLMEEQVQKDFENHDKKAVDDSEIEKAREASDGSDLKFDIKRVLFNESSVLTKEELDKVAAEYIGTKSTLKQLYKMVDNVNQLYRQKGYAVCRAFLPEQTIKGGTVKVTLVEGKTGKVKLDNVRFTNKNYVISQTGLKTGKVNNLKDLNRRISLFNATNDAQLSVKLASGEEQGTTDYILALDEPDPHYLYIFGDTSGSASTGIVRYGIGWSINSLLGIRDTLSLNFVKSDFSDSGGVSYSLPITGFGTKLSASVSGNGMNPDQGAGMNSLRPRSDSVSYSVGISQPLCVTASTRIVGDVSWSKQYSRSRLREISSTYMDHISWKYAGGIAFTHFGRGIVWYHRHSLTRSTYHNVIDPSDASVSWIYNLNFLRQQMFMNGHSLTIKANAQLTPSDHQGDRPGLSTSDYFYIGGVGSVRGYTESQMGAEKGFNVSVEYAMPFRKYRNLTPILFVDYGKVFGAYTDNLYVKNTQLLSAGLGLRWTSDNGRMNATLWGGFPLLKEANGDKVNSFKVHASFYAQIDDWFAFLFKEPKKTDSEEEKLAKAKEAVEQERVNRQKEIAQKAQQLKNNLARKTVKKQRPRSTAYISLLKEVRETQKNNNRKRY